MILRSRYIFTTARILLRIYIRYVSQITQFLSRNFATIIMIYTLCAHSSQHARNTENKAAITLKSLISLYPFIVARAAPEYDKSRSSLRIPFVAWITRRFTSIFPPVIRFFSVHLEGKRKKEGGREGNVLMTIDSRRG